MSGRKRIDLLGVSFGRLIVIDGPTRKKKAIQWKCECSCGNIIERTTGSLRKGAANQSCGCFKREGGYKMIHLKPGAGFRRALYNYTKAAKDRGLSFDLSEEQFKDLSQSVCYYCGAEPRAIIKTKSGYEIFVYNGVDRVDNAVGYSADNSVSCCRDCNRAKRTLSKDDFIALCKRVVARHT